MEYLVAVARIAEIMALVASVSTWMAPGELSDQTTYDFTASMWVGDGYYTYVDEAGKSTTVSGVAVINPNYVFDGKNVFAGPGLTVKMKLLEEPTGSTPVGATFSSTYYRMTGGSYYTFVYDIGTFTDLSFGSGFGLTNLGRASGFTYNASTGVRKTPSGVGSTVGAAFGPSGDTAATQGQSTYLTNDQTIANRDPRAGYVPPGSYSYDDLRAALIQFFNDEYNLDIELDNPDIPKLEDILEEPTEPATGGNGFEFDYGEVISPTELESLLNQETYDLAEIDTDIPTFPTMPDVDIFESMPQGDLEASVLASIPVVATVSWNTLASLGLLSVFISVAIPKLILKILRNAKGSDN